MSSNTKPFPLDQFILTTATGSFDLIASKSALKAVAREPGFTVQNEVLLDLRDIKCQMSTFDIFELAQHMAYPNPALDTNRKIAVLVTGQLSFNHAHFLELCANNRSVNVRAFDEYEAADEWLHADLPPDPKQTG